MVVTLSAPTRGISRENAAVLQGLLVVSVLMSESADEEQILYLASTSLSSVARCRLAGFFCLATKKWKVSSSRLQDAPRLRGVLERQLEALVPKGGPLVLDSEWGFAFSLRGPRECWGFLVLLADKEPSSEEELLLLVLAQQTGLALTVAQMVGTEHETSVRLTRTNEALGRSVADLQRTMEIHARLDEVASSGGGHDGLARTLHEVTGFPVAIEDRYGNLRAWAPGNTPDAYPKPIRSIRERLLRDLASDPHPKRHEGRVIALASPRSDVAGTLALVDPEGNAGKFEFVALEHAATVLGMELARLNSMAEVEHRLRRELVEELLAGVDDEGVFQRAQAFGHDLQQEHRVVIVHRNHAGSDDHLLHLVRQADRECGVASLMMGKGKAVTLLSPAAADWEAFRARVEELAGTKCRIAVGSSCRQPSDFPRSHREAQVAMALQENTLAGPNVLTWESLGAYQILSTVDDVEGVERFVHQQLGRLFQYDTQKKSDLVETLYRYLESGCNHANAAQELAVHRNTLKYRLDRIGEISGRDLTDPDTRFNLQLATRGWQLLKALGRRS
jgi:DNA-binding PucR family transcriptional regulator